MSVKKSFKRYFFSKGLVTSFPSTLLEHKVSHTFSVDFPVFFTFVCMQFKHLHGWSEFRTDCESDFVHAQARDYKNEGSQEFENIPASINNMPVINCEIARLDGLH